ncbi:MD-2-related lipid-recognition [Hesseltinella vesiculosa]|uniref:Phosphatidylglycerol/phosphatidylinositol transfer protein n=1 Tax=Hesseltinella vesiculosa TaxID=101127 RepID=A0A1X2GEC6_9FUNG|nr:MD-2-related lipid-recognition [Hesseltinella vesiculosa]
MKFTLATVFALVAAANAGLVSRTAVTYSFCSTGATDPLKISSVDLSPYPAVPGNSITLSAVGTSTATVNSGASAVVTVSTGGFTLWSATYNVCTDLTINATCPIAPGTYSLSKTITVPSILPAGTYTMQVSAKNADGSELTCITAPLNVA